MMSQAAVFWYVIHSIPKGRSTNVFRLYLVDLPAVERSMMKANLASQMAKLALHRVSGGERRVRITQAGCKRRQ